MKKHLFYSFLILSAFLQSTAGHAQDHLLLSEIALAPDSGEFIEIYNPTSATISLDNYYLGDNSDYALVPSGTTNVINSDFIVKFPTGSTILPGAALVVAMKGDLFVAYYGMAPDFEILSVNGSVTDMITINTGIAPTLTNSGEGVVLFFWDGNTDLVSDVDIMNAGIPTLANQIISKTGISVDGPDGDSNSSTYFTDAGTMPLQLSAPGIGFSTKRIHLEGNNEIPTNGNGLTGNDETSENTAVTWDSAYTAPTPGIVNIITGINSPSIAQIINLYPNPTNGELFIKHNFSNTFELKLFSITGNLLLRENIPAGKKDFHMDLSNFTSGMYFLVMNDGEILISEKIIIR